MMHKPISLISVSLCFANKTCFEDFTASIYPGSRIAVIGRNGSGKSSLLNILRKALEPSSGQIDIPDDPHIGYVEQTINDYENLSGGQRLNKRLTEALALCPDVLILDEPTNHLDIPNRKSLIRMLQNYPGTLIVVSHDVELLCHCVDTFWHIDDQKIHTFSGAYDDYIHELKRQRASVEKELSQLKQNKKETHTQLMKEQQRAAKSKSKGHKSIENRKWPTVVSKAKTTRSNQTSGKKRASINQKNHDLTNQLSKLRLPKIILPNFSLNSGPVACGIILSIEGADIGYPQDRSLLKNICLSLSGKERIAISGKNASGKSTLLKAILGKNNIFKTGHWHLPKNKHIGYLDQHYSNLEPDISVIEHIYKSRPDWHETEIRQHLNDFLFQKNSEVSSLARNLSGGEKARLSLSLISANTPRLLILDEITNNLDLETKAHVIQVLKAYPGSMIIVSHEEHFLNAIGIDHSYTIENAMILN